MIKSLAITSPRYNEPIYKVAWHLVQVQLAPLYLDIIRRFESPAIFSIESRLADKLIIFGGRRRLCKVKVKDLWEENAGKI